MRSARRIFIISAVIALASIGFVAYQMFWGPERLDLAGKGLPELLENGGLLGLIAIPVVLVIVALSLRPLLRILFPDQIKDGVNAPARVLKVWDTGVSLNDNPQVGLLLEVTPPGGSPIQVETRTVVSRLNAALVQPGVTAEVRLDPQRPTRLRVLALHVLSADQPDAAARMEQLNRLRDQGLITAEEYSQKREEILRSL